MAALYVSVRALPPDADGRFPDVLMRTVVACALGLSIIALFQWAVLGRSRPPATMQNPNFLAEYLIYGVVMVLSRATDPLPRVEWGSRLGWAAIVLPLLLAVAASRSRGGALLAAGAAGFFLWWRVGWRRAVPVALVAAACLLLVPNPLLDRFAGHGDRYAFARLQMWTSALRVFLENPLGGRGGAVQVLLEHDACAGRGGDPPIWKGRPDPPQRVSLRPFRDGRSRGDRAPGRGGVRGRLPSAGIRPPGSALRPRIGVNPGDLRRPRRGRR